MSQGMLSSARRFRCDCTSGNVIAACYVIVFLLFAAVFVHGYISRN
jgi:hypothetical protein